MIYHAEAKDLRRPHAPWVPKLIHANPCAEKWSIFPSMKLAGSVEEARVAPKKKLFEITVGESRITMLASITNRMG